MLQLLGQNNAHMPLNEETVYCRSQKEKAILQRCYKSSAQSVCGSCAVPSRRAPPSNVPTVLLKVQRHKVLNKTKRTAEGIALVLNVNKAMQMKIFSFFLLKTQVFIKN